MTLLSGPNISGNEWKYVKDCLDTAWVSSVGAYVTRFEQQLAEFTGTNYAVATSNGTAALHMALMLAGVKAGDYVLVPNITFVATLNAISYTGAQPVLIDIDPATWQMDVNLLEDFLNREAVVEHDLCICVKDRRPIRAVMPVHVLGNMVDMEKLLLLTEKFKLEIVEDATEALGSYYDHKHSGSIGKMGCFSFNGNKIITTGGGGMIVTNDKELAVKAKHLTTQAKNDPFEYSHDDIGYNYRLVNILAAMGVAQMEQLPAFIERKKEINAFYRDALGGCADIAFQEFSPRVDSNYWLFTIRSSGQKALLDALNKAGLQSRPFWVPMNQLPMFTGAWYVHNNDVSGKVYSECLSIPCSTNISEKELEQVVQTIKNTLSA